MKNFKFLTKNNYVGEVEKSTLPVLFCCLEGKIFDEDQYGIINEIVDLFHGHIQVCVNQREDKEFFSKKFDLLGTPFFLFISQGTVVDRLLGFSKKEDLEIFIRKNIEEKNQFVLS